MAAATTHTVVLTLTGDEALAGRLAKKLAKNGTVEHLDTPPTGRITVTVTERGDPQGAADAAVAKITAADEAVGDVLYAVDPIRE